MAAVLNGASVTCGCLAPGEIITVLGTAIGPSPTGLEIGADGKLATTLNGTQLLINGIPVPLLYASTGQLNAIVPHEVATGGNATIQVMSEGQVSGIWEVPMSPAAPATLTLSATGVGQGAINGPSKPAARGTVIQIYATGEGVTTPPGVTGSITGTDLTKPALPARVSHRRCQRDGRICRIGSRRCYRIAASETLWFHSTRRPVPQLAFR